MEMEGQISDFVSALEVADSYKQVTLNEALVCILPWVHRGEDSQNLTIFFKKKCIKCVLHKHVQFPGQLIVKDQKCHKSSIK